METVRIEDYLLENEVPVYVSCPIDDAGRMERAVAYCSFVAAEIDSDRTLTPYHVGQLLISHYGYVGAEKGPNDREIDISMELKNYEVWGRATIQRGILRRDPCFQRGGLADDIKAMLKTRPVD